MSETSLENKSGWPLVERHLDVYRELTVSCLCKRTSLQNTTPPGHRVLARLAVIFSTLIFLISYSGSALASGLTLDVTAPVNTTSVVIPYNIAGIASDNNEVRIVQLAIRSLDSNKYWNGTGFQSAFVRVPASVTGSPQNKNWAYNSVPTEVGRYSLIAWAWDDNFDFIRSPALWYNVVAEVDSQIPTVSFSNVSAGGSYDSSLTLQGNAFDNLAIDTVELAIRNVDTEQYWNGSFFQNKYVRVLAQVSGEADSATWAYEDFPDQSATYSVSARARDDYGNVTTPSTVWFRYESGVLDITPPTTTITTPAVNGQTLTATDSFTGTVSDDQGYDRVQLAIRHLGQGRYWNGTRLVDNYSRVPATVSGDGLEGTWQMNSLPEEDGEYSLQAWSWDEKQNYEIPFVMRFSINGSASDNEPASVAFNSSVSAVTVGAPVILSGSASDNVGVNRVEIAIRHDTTAQYWNGSNFQAGYSRVLATLSGSGENVEWSYDNFPTNSGTYSLGAWVWDEGQNTASKVNTWLKIYSDTPAPPGVPLSDYNLVFGDEFNGTALDPNKWDTSFYWGPYQVINGEEQFYMDTLGMHADTNLSPFEFTGDSLIIKAVETTANLQPPAQPDENDPIWMNDPDKRYNADFIPAERQYISGIITSASDFNFTHGYAEARVKLPVGRGLWPAFWLLNSKYVEDSPEIDIMEYLGQDSDKVYHTYHYFDVANNWEKISSPSYETQVENLDRHHTFGMAWEADQLIWYVDGVETRRITDSDLSISKQSMYVIANMAVGGSWPGSPDDSTLFPAKYELDYIRVYQKKPATPITPAVLQNDFQLMFSDEFDSNELDENKWNTAFLWGPYFPINNEEQIYLDEFGHHRNFGDSPFFINNGLLNIRAEPISSDQLPDQLAVGSPEWSVYPSQQHYAPYRQANGWTPRFTSGILTSYDAFKFVHGYVEMRAKLPEGDGLWPAFWLLNGYYVGPQPEIDIMELQGELPGTVHHSYHFNSNNGVLNSSATKYSLPNSGSFSDDFHTFGVEWTADTIKWYVDGQVTRTLNSSDVSTQLMYIIVNLAVGGNFVGPVSSDATPAEFTIDYIRAYQRKSTP